MPAYSPEKALREIAEILARGYLRFSLKRAKETPEGATQEKVAEPEKTSESLSISLDVCRPPSPHVVTDNTEGEAR